MQNSISQENQIHLSRAIFIFVFTFLATSDALVDAIMHNGYARYFLSPNWPSFLIMAIGKFEKPF